MAKILFGTAPENLLEKYRNALKHFSSQEFSEKLSDDEFESHRTHNAKAALDFPWSCQRMSPAQFDASLREFPWNALKNEHSCHRMNDFQFGWAVKKAPWAALEYRHSFSRLTTDQFSECLSREPFSPIVLPHVAEIIDGTILESAIFRYPEIAMKNPWVFQKAAVEMVICFVEQNEAASSIPEVVEILSERSFLRCVR